MDYFSQHIFRTSKKKSISGKALSKMRRMMLVSALQHFPVRSKKGIKYAPYKCTGKVKYAPYKCTGKVTPQNPLWYIAGLEVVPQ